MAKKGRPFVYQEGDEKPVTISLRLPKALHTRLERYAKQHRQSISELMRDGLEWRIGEGDPRGLGDGAGTHNSQEYYGNTESIQEAQAAEALQEVRTLLRQQWEQIQALAQALERQKVLDGDGVYSSNTGIQLKQQGHRAAHEPASKQVSENTRPFDTTKHHLGKLCQRGHDHEGTGQSLRNTDNQCLKCKAEDKRAKDARKRQATAATT